MSTVILCGAMIIARAINKEYAVEADLILFCIAIPFDAITLFYKIKK